LISPLVELRLATGHLSDVHMSHLAIGPASFGPVHTSLVVIIDLGRMIDIEEAKVTDEEAETLGEFAALVSGVNLGFTRASTNSLLTVALPCDSSPHSNDNDALKRSTLVDGHHIGLVRLLGL
jgi:hypothetical protein